MDGPRPRRHAWRLTLSILAIAAGTIVLLVVVVGIGLRGSLPRLAGTRAVAGLAGAVTIDRDALGIPTITAADRRDASFALGFLHAQDRYFQMDVMRRSGAGELSALFGTPALEMDRAVRVHRFRARARRLAGVMPHREHLDAYARGVNAGLASLGGPFATSRVKSPCPSLMACNMIAL